MDNSEKYELLQSDEVKLPSNIAIIPFDNDKTYTPEDLKSRLAKSSSFKLISFELVEESEDYNAYVDVVVEFWEEEYRFSLYINENGEINLAEYGFANRVSEEDIAHAQKAKQYIEISMYFNEDHLTSYLLQLKVLNTLEPHASLVLDFSALQLLSARWLEMAATSNIPPSPNYLFTVHGVFDEKEDGKRNYWLHTHGLHRCGSIELEVLNFSNGANELHALVSTVAKRFMSEMAKEKERFEIGYDGMGINLCWVKWEDALKMVPENIIGAMGDRVYEDGTPNIHAEPSGVLFAVEDGNMMSPEIYVKTLQENPIYYITSEETLRMSLLAKERFGHLHNLFVENSPAPKKKGFFSRLTKQKEEEEPTWTFLVKLGLVVDDAENENQKEHLWFKLMEIDGDNLTGELINQPYWIARLNDGDTATLPLELLTDWLIYAPNGSYTPDTIYELI